VGDCRKFAERKEKFIYKYKGATFLINGATQRANGAT